MQSVCGQCHGENFVKQFYSQFDGLIVQYDTRVSAPATRIRKALINMGELSRDNFDDKLDKIYWNLVYREGKRARHGAAMMGANYAWSEGMQEVSESFYFEFIPEVKRILGRKADSFLRHYGYTEPKSKR